MDPTSEAQFFKNKFQELLTGSSFELYEKTKAKNRVLCELSQIIMGQPIVYDGQPSSNLFKILLRKLKPQLSGTGIDERVCDVASRKLAKFVESVMREAYLKHKHERRHRVRPSSAYPSSEAVIEKIKAARAKTADCPVRQQNFNHKRKPSKEETIKRDLQSTDSGSESFMRIEKVPTSYVRDVRKTSSLYKAETGGRRVYTPEGQAGKGDQKKSNASRPSTVETNRKPGRSSWFNDTAKGSELRSEGLKQKYTPHRKSEIRTLSSTTWKPVVANSSPTQSTGNHNRKVIVREFRNVRRDSSTDSYMSSTSDAKSPPHSPGQSSASQQFTSRPHTTSNDGTDRSSKLDNRSTRIRSTDSKGYSFSISKIYPNSKS